MYSRSCAGGQPRLRLDQQISGDQVIMLEVGNLTVALFGGAPCTVSALCPRCAKSRLFFTNGSHGSQGPEFCTPDAGLNGSCTLLWVGGFQGCSRDKQRNNWQ